MNLKKLLGISLLACGSIFAALKPGESVLINGELSGAEIDQATGMRIKTPDFWALQGNRKYFIYNHKGGPAGTGSVMFTNENNEKTGEISLRQQGLELVPNGKYKISAMVRTKNFQSSNNGVIVFDRGWNRSLGLVKFQANQDWQLMEKEFVLMDSPEYAFAIYACSFKGVLEIADVKLTAISEDALAQTNVSKLGKKLRDPMFVPWKPLLNNIPAENGNSKMTFHFFGKLPEGSANDYNVVYTYADFPAVTVPLSTGENTLVLKGLKKLGDFPLTVKIVSKATKESVYQAEHLATLIDVPEYDASEHKRLNNLVVEVLDKPIAKNAAVQKFEFSMFRDGWVFIAAQNASAEGLEVVLDGKTVIKNSTPRLETFRDILMGRHKLEVKGAANGGRIVARSIPEIYNYCPGVNNGVSENPKFDWEFQKKYVLPAVTTQNGGNIPEDVRDEFFDAGYKWIANLGTTNLKDGEDLKNRLEKCSGMTKPYFQGVSCDEQFFNSVTSILPYTEGMKLFKPTNDHVIYTWITNYPNITGAHNDFMSTCINASHGRGRLISEVYCRTMPTLDDAKDYLDEVIVEKVRSFKRYFPGAINHMGIILGDFNQVPILSLAHHPNVDYKYYLDLQFNIIANNPDCKDMAVTGYWGSYYADHELHRWAFMLTRHYCVEGKKSMLSDKYGFKYDPAFISNGDFDKGFDGWTVVGNVRNDKHPTFASRSQNRWGGNGGQGDTFAVFSKKAGETSSVSRTAKGFEVGKYYCLQFSTVDFNDVKANKLNPRLFGISAKLSDGAEIDNGLSWTHVDKREKGRYKQNNGVARINLHHIVFKATKPEITFTFDNAKSLNGEELGLNYVMLTPFLTEE